MIQLLKIIFMVIFGVMVFSVTSASLEENMFQLPPQVSQDPWFITGLWDAYFGFLTFYCWVFYRSPSWISRLVWFLLIMSLGNMAMAIYVLIILFKIPANTPASQWASSILLRPLPKNT
jgi:hypothetical protein